MRETDAALTGADVDPVPVHPPAERSLQLQRRFAPSARTDEAAEDAVDKMMYYRKQTAEARA